MCMDIQAEWKRTWKPLFGLVGLLVLGCRVILENQTKKNRENEMEPGLYT